MDPYFTLISFILSQFLIQILNQMCFKCISSVGHLTLKKTLFRLFEFSYNSWFSRNRFNYRLKVYELPFLYKISSPCLSLLLGLIFCSTFFMLAHIMYLQTFYFLSYLNIDI
jgi:hypothetical protein